MVCRFRPKWTGSPILAPWVLATLKVFGIAFGSIILVGRACAPLGSIKCLINELQMQIGEVVKRKRDREGKFVGKTRGVERRV